MITKEQFDKHYQELIGEGLHDFLIKRANDILKSGAVDMEHYEDDFRLPKLVLCVALKDARWQFEPFNDHDKNTIKNMEHF